MSIFRGCTQIHVYASDAQWCPIHRCGDAYTLDTGNGSRSFSSTPSQPPEEMTRCHLYTSYTIDLLGPSTFDPSSAPC
ncbi:hypothetical protein TIFTF001_030892 [Ficus carica]|uniref:Uncharacterized protein n=1 Tax=Ficus carica TaxID=3494 RepID=A0AA88DUK5_FICCA|nr:hypothetical protein TIFTF001_030892 [Ficus carica]